MIFSLLNIRKKLAATLAGIAIAAACLWGLSMWQDISLMEMSRLLLGLLLMLIVIMLAAVALIALLKLLLAGLRRLGAGNGPGDGSG